MARQPKYKTPKEIKKAITRYFKNCEARNKPTTMSGLALSLGFMSRTAVLSYEKKAPFYEIIKDAKLRIQQDYEERLIERKSGVAGIIFSLKNNFNWKDRQEFTGSDGTPITINLMRFTNIPINEAKTSRS